MNYALEHTDCERMVCDYDYIIDVDCFFDPYSQNLMFAYVGGIEISEMLRDKVIQDFERQYAKAVEEEAYESKLSAMIDAYESKKDYAWKTTALMAHLWLLPPLLTKLFFGSQALLQDLFLLF